MPNPEHLEILKRGVEEWNLWREEHSEIKPDLSEANLSGADLSRADLWEASITRANLSGADPSRRDLSGADIIRVERSGADLSRRDLSGADLREVNLSEANPFKANITRANIVNLSRADLSRAKLNSAKLRRAKLRKANLSRADLSGADLSGANLSGADLYRADLSGAKLSGAKLSGATQASKWEYTHLADLSGANLIGANLSRADLSGANLRGADLWEANLSGANLNSANLSGANLWEANLSGADLRGANLWEANLSEANLSEVVINEITQYRQARGCIRGVNGLYSERTDSAALMTLTPPGDSMKGANASAVVESLTHARSLHVFSMTLAALVFYIAVMKPQKIKLPLIDGEIPTGQFGLFAMPFSIGFLTLVASFMSDALRGAMYLHSRDDAMKVGQFPWALSRFSGKDWPSKLLSFLTRFVIAFHPLTYLYFLFGKQWPYPRWVFITFGVILLFLSVWIFTISQGFQRPILFDRKTEEERKSDLAKLAKSVEEQTKAMTKLITLLESKQSPDSVANDTKAK